MVERATTRAVAANWPAEKALLEVSDLKVEFRSMRGVVKVLDGVDLAVRRGEILGLVGESGCGKTVTGLTVMGLLQRPQAQVTAGSMVFEGTDLLSLSEDEMAGLRGRRLAMVFQDPLASLNPVFTVGHQLVGVLRQRTGSRRREALERARVALHSVGLPSSDVILGSYPHQLSGGMRQRVCLAMALSCGAPLLIGDEPTTALDVTIQAQILRVLCDLREENDLGMVLVTHNVGVAAQVCDRVAVMYAGVIVEVGDTEAVLTQPRHPYAAALIECLPQGKAAGDLHAIPGSVPDLIDPPPGCRFHPRCSHVMEVCSVQKPAMAAIEPGHLVACHWVEAQ